MGIWSSRPFTELHITQKSFHFVTSLEVIRMTPGTFAIYSLGDTVLRTGNSYLVFLRWTHKEGDITRESHLAQCLDTEAL